MAFPSSTPSSVERLARQSTPDEPASLKSQRKPNITPRTFRRFFAPRRSLQGSRRGATSRAALRDVSPSGINKLTHTVRPQCLQTSDLLFDVEVDRPPGSSHLLRQNSKPIEDSQDVAAISPPSKRRKFMPDIAVATQCLDTPSACLVVQDHEHSRFHPSRPVQRSVVRYLTHDTLSRELNWAGKSWSRPPRSCSLDFQIESGSFYSRPEDTHTCRNPFSASTNLTLPFCTAPCNTNSLVAIGDEEGAVRLLETRANSQPGFKKSYLAFHPHENAILDMAFSSDDSILATASGDQICKIVDVRTQQALQSLAGHVSSVKQVKFQPGSCSNVIATSSRDGCVRVWDLRCSSPARPIREVRMEAENSAYRGLRTIARPPIFNAACINNLSRAHAGCAPILEPSDGAVNLSSTLKTHTRRSAAAQTRNEVSVTAISFLTPSSSHILLSGCEADSTIKAWDLRMVQSSRRDSAVPLSSTRQPLAHHLHRRFGLTSMALSADGARIFTMCKDNTIYAYSTSHIVLGTSAEFDGANRKPRRTAMGSQGTGPIYGLRHPLLKVSTFYVKLAVRRPWADNVEVIAAGSSSSCPILFPAHDTHLRRLESKRMRSNQALGEADGTEDFPIYHCGTSLVRGHEKEVTGVAWSSEGSLVTLSDDSNCRVWRTGGQARELKSQGGAGNKRCGYGVAEDVNFDDGDEDEDE